MYLYMLRCSVTSKLYIGATTLSMPRRLGLHRDAAVLKERTTVLAKAIREHGWSAFKPIVLAETADHSVLMQMERQTIAALNTMVPNGYNMSSGGMGVPDLKLSKETRAKIRAARLGRPSWNKGKKTGPMPEATRLKQRLAHLGQKAWNKGVPATLATRAKLSAMRRGGLNHNARAMELDSQCYPSVADAIKATGLSRMQVRYRLMLGRARYLED